MNSVQAQKFADEWVSSWNDHNIERILDHYEDDFVLVSPAIVKVFGEASGQLQGKSTIRDYWLKALAAYPNLHFVIESVYLGVESVTIVYEGVTGKAVESFWFGENGRVSKSVVNYSLS